MRLLYSAAEQTTEGSPVVLRCFGPAGNPIWGRQGTQLRQHAWHMLLLLIGAKSTSPTRVNGFPLLTYTVHRYLSQTHPAGNTDHSPPQYPPCPALPPPPLLRRQQKCF